MKYMLLLSSSLLAAFMSLVGPEGHELVAAIGAMAVVNFGLFILLALEELK